MNPELLTAMLMELGFDAFEEREAYLTGYIAAENWGHNISDRLNNANLDYTVERIKDQNWNAIWESNFEPIIVADRCIVRADFHTPVREYEYDIIINPKMSFGTGHHATTTLMMEYLLENPPHGLQVIDAGTGTGILAILAEKLGARNVYAFDTEDWAVENCKENCLANHCSITEISQGAIGQQMYLDSCDLLLANIHKNVLIDEMGTYFARCKKGGILVISGFYEADLADIDLSARSVGFVPKDVMFKNDWYSRVYSNPF
jgi:ribosomal protein L11 methyltransferase